MQRIIYKYDTLILWLALGMGSTLAYMSLTSIKFSAGLIAIFAFSIIAYFKVRFALLALILYVPFMHLLPQISFGTGLNLFNGLTVLVLISWMIHHFREKNLQLPVNPIAKPLIIFIFMGLVSIFVEGLSMGSGVLFENIIHFWQWMGVSLLMFITALVIDDEKQIRQILWLITGIILFAAVYFLIEFSAMSSSGGYSHNLRIAGIFGIGGENDMGAFFAQFILVPIFLLRTSSNKMGKLLLAGIVAITLIALLYTYSRGAYLGLVIGLFTYMIMKKDKLFILILIGGLALSPVLSPSSVQDRITMTVSANDGVLESSSASRLEFWKAGMGMWQDNFIFGIGYNNFSNNLPSYMNISDHYGARTAHNQFVSIISEMGLLGGIGILYLFISFGRLGKRLIKIGSNSFLKHFGMIYFSMIMGMFMINNFGVRFVRAELTGLFWVISGLVVRSIWLSAKEKELSTNLKLKGINNG